MINELKNDINNGSINHAYFLECNDEKKGLEEARSFASEILGKSIDNNPDCTIFLTEENTIKVESIRDLQKSHYLKMKWLIFMSTCRRIYLIYIQLSILY